MSGQYADESNNFASGSVPDFGNDSDVRADAGTSVKPIAIVPKKRPYVDPDTVAAIHSARKNEKPLKTVTRATDTPPVKKKRQYVKKHSRKANSKPPLEKGDRDVKRQPKKVSTRQSTNKVPSTPLSKEEIEEEHFWENPLTSDFDSLYYEKLLNKWGYSDEQAALIKQSFITISRKIYIASTFTDRFMQTHLCMDCQFCISHHCVSVHTPQYVQSNASAMCATTIAPESMNICSCGFGFFHSHANNSDQVSDNLNVSMNINSLFEHDRSHTVSCRKCHMQIVMRNRNENICSDLTKLKNVASALEKQFYKFLQDLIHSKKLLSMKEPSIKELYACSRRCCMIFHQCPKIPSNPILSIKTQSQPIL